MKASLAQQPLTIIVTDLIDHGLIRPPTRVFGTHSGKRIEALLTPDGIFVHRGNNYRSPSVAAGQAITADVGVSTIGRDYASVNGWKFWRVRCPDGRIRSLADIREQLLSSC
jgi:hypothetical protein